MRPVSAYEVACCFRVDDDLTHSLSHPKNFVLLDCGIPSATSRVLLDPIIRRLEQIRTENFEIMQPQRLAAPAAITHVPAFTNGAVGSRIPDKEIWSKALRENPMTNLLLEIAA